MAEMKLYKSHIPSVNFLFGNGKAAIFIGGRYSTDVDSEIATLDNEIRLGHPHIYFDADEPTADVKTSEELIQGLREQIKDELIKEMAAATDPSNDMGSSENQQLKPASTIDIATAAQGGSGAGLAARLVALNSANK